MLQLSDHLLAPLPCKPEVREPAPGREKGQEKGAEQPMLQAF